MAGNRVLDQESPEVAPTGAPANDYQRIETSPAMFGGLIGQATEKLGSAGEQASNVAFQTADFYAKTTVNDELNSFMKRGQAIMSGDPDNPNVPGYLNTTGATAMSGRSVARKQLDDAYNDSMKRLPPYAAQIFAQDGRRYVWSMGERIDDHANQQFKTYTQSTQKSLEETLASTVGTTPADDGVYHQNVVTGTQKIISYEAAQGNGPDSPQLKEHLQQFHTQMVTSRVLGWMNDDPVAAKAFLKKEFALKEINPAQYDALQQRLLKPVGDAAANEEGNHAWAGTNSPAPKSATTPVAAGAQVFGDSLGEGVKTAYGLGGDTKVGRVPQQVASALEALPDGALTGKPVVISTGASNDPNSVSYTTDQIRTAIKKGANPADITVLGVGDRKDFAGLNDKIKALASAEGAKFQPIDPSNLSADRVHPASYTKVLGGATASAASSGAPVSATSDQLFNAFHGQESGGGRNTTTSIDNAHGDMQITPDTFSRFAKPGERLDNSDDNKAVGRRILDHYAQKYNGDAARVAVAYFSGEGNVAPVGSATPWISNRHDGQGTYVSQYVDSILRRLGKPGMGVAPPPLGHGSLTADGPLANPGWQGATPDQPDRSPNPLPPEAAPATADAGTTPPAPTPVNVTTEAPAPTKTGASSMVPMTGQPPQTVDQWREAALYNLMRRTDLNDQEKKYGEAAITDRWRTLKITAEATAQQRKEQTNAAGDEYMKMLISGQADPNILDRLAKDHRFDGDGAAREHMAETIMKWTGKPPDVSFGADWSRTRADMLSPPDAPGHISDFQEVYRRAQLGGINPAGVSNLYEMKMRNAKDVDTHAYDAIAQKFLEGAKKRMSFDGAGATLGYEGMKDPEGLQKYDYEFAPTFIKQFSGLMAKAKETGDMGPVNDFLTEKNVNSMVDQIRSQRDIDKAKQRALFGAGAPEPPKGLGVDPKGWQTVMKTPPSIEGRPLPTDTWSEVVSTLLRNPSAETVAAFDRHFAPAGMSGAEIVKQLRGATPGKPENVGNTSPERDAMEPLFNTTMGVMP